MVLALLEMQTVSPRVWTLVAVYVSYDGNHYFTNASHPIYIYIYIYISVCECVFVFILSFSLANICCSEINIAFNEFIYLKELSNRESEKYLCYVVRYLTMYKCPKWFTEFKKDNFDLSQIFFYIRLNISGNISSSKSLSKQYRFRQMTFYIMFEYSQNLNREFPFLMNFQQIIKLSI